MRTQNWLTLIALSALAVLVMDRAVSDDTEKNKDRAKASVSASGDQKGAQHAHSVQRASKLIGMNVQNHEGESLGDIKDLVVDLHSGKVKYAAVSFGGFLGAGDKLFAVPMSAFKIKHDGDDTHFVLHKTKQELKDAPGFNQDSWPDSADAHWAEAEAFYGKHGAAADDNTAKGSNTSTSTSGKKGSSNTKSNTGKGTDSDNQDRSSTDSLDGSSKNRDSLKGSSSTTRDKDDNP